MDFCDAIGCTPDVPTVGYQGFHNRGLPISVVFGLAYFMVLSAYFLNRNVANNQINGTLLTCSDNLQLYPLCKTFSATLLH